MGAPAALTAGRRRQKPVSPLSRNGWVRGLGGEGSRKHIEDRRVAVEHPPHFPSVFSHVPPVSPRSPAHTCVAQFSTYVTQPQISGVSHRVETHGPKDEVPEQGKLMGPTITLLADVNSTLPREQLLYQSCGGEVKGRDVEV